MGSSLLKLIAVLLEVGAALAAGTVVLMARVLLRPPRMTTGRAMAIYRRLSPGDVGLRYEECTFTVREERSGRPIHLAGWWIPHPESHGRCVVLIHGYSDAKVGVLTPAKLLHELGVNVLALDLRAHGQSGGKYCTAGFFERHDMNQAIDQLRAERPDEARKIVLFGVSLGAAVAAATALLRKDLDGVVLQCPYAEFPSAVAAYAGRVGLPGGLLQRLAFRLAQWISGANFAAVRPIDMIRRITTPLLWIEAEHDLVVSPADADRLRAAVADAAAAQPRNPVRTLRLEGSDHFMDEAAGSPAYRQALAEFLSGAFCEFVAADPPPVR